MLLLNLELFVPVVVLDTILLVGLPAFVSIMISEISVPAIDFISPIDILWDGVIILMTIDDSGTKDDVLKLVAIDNINMSSVRKSIACTVLIVEIVLVFVGTNYTRKSSRQDICRFYGVRLEVDRGPRYRTAIPETI